MTASYRTDSQSTSPSIYNRSKGGTAGNQGSASASSNDSKANGARSVLQDERKPAKRGFAAMDPARQKEIAAQGGRAAHESGNAHQFTVEEARAAGKKSHSTRQQNSAFRPSL